MTEHINDQLVLISGESGSGKSASLMGLPNQDRVLYLNCESGKRLPFKNSFQKHVIVNPYQVYQAFDATVPGGAMYNDIDTIVIDTLTYLMEMFESMFVVDAADGRKAWGDYFQFFKKLMQQHVASSEKNVIFLAHTRAELDEKAMAWKVNVPIKGALKNNGLESYFSTIVSTKKIDLVDLEDYANDMLHITEDDILVGFKYVFQTRLTKQTTGERIRGPMGLFTRKETFIDNDAQQLLNHLHSFYN